MQVIRRTAFRAANTVACPRSIHIRTPLSIRQQTLPINAQLFRRFASNDTDSKQDSIPSSSDHSETSAVKSAIDSVTQSASESAAGVSTYAGQAVESIQENFETAKERVVDNAHALGEAAGFSAPARERRPQRSRDGDRPQRSQYQDRPQRPDRFDRGDRSAYNERAARERDAIAPNPSVYVGNLLFDTPKERLAEFFEEFGEVRNVKIATDERGLSKGFGYVEFATTEQASAAIEAKHQEVFDGRRIVVNYQNTTKRAAPRAMNEESKTLFIGNLAFEMSDQDLNKLFKDIKNVVDVRVAIDRRTGQPRGFAHAEFTDIESAVAACAQLSNQECFGRKLRVDYSGGSSSARREGGDRRGGSRGGYGGDRGDRGDGASYGGRDRY